jgi:hypothetical protein
MIKCHAYGAGIQSIAIMYKYLNGEIEKPDVVVFADTKAEPQDVYEKVERDRAVCEKNGIRFEVVSGGDLGKSKKFVPLFTLNKNGRRGTLLRQCTDRFKIQPIRRFLRKEMNAETVEMWLGISTDEASRMKPSRVKYIQNTYPLIDMNMSRADCENYLGVIGVTASKSACVFCPYRNKKNWNIIRSNESDWRLALDYDRSIREERKHKGVLMFVHASGKPLDVAIDGDNTQTNLFINECEGYCGL